jgi:gliding motility-associated-like protein
MSFREKLFLALLMFSLSPALSLGQCVVINEILINGPGGCDGGCSPNSEEWVELYNTCNQAIDISCYVMTDGDFTVTFPPGSSIGANGFFTIGSNNSGVSLDVNLSSCNCTSGSGIGVFTNGAEQIIVLDDNGAIVNAVQWGGGQVPMNITSSLSGCPNINANFNSVTTFETLPTGGGQGFSLARSCDGANTWEERPETDWSGDASNGQPAQVDFDASDATICPGECIDFTDLSIGDPITWSWQFEGSSTANSDLENPTSICYTSNGTFDVMLTITNSCGTFSYTATDFIDVSGTLTPSISAATDTQLCEGENVVLTTTAIGSFQWNYNGLPIPGSIASSYIAGLDGDYSVSMTSGGCNGESNIISVEVFPMPTGALSTNSPLVLCPGTSATINLSGTFDTFDWRKDGISIENTSPSISADESGIYTVEVFNEIGCSITTNSIEITVLEYDPLTISSSAGTSLCPGIATILSTQSGFPNYDWLLNGNQINLNTNSIEATDLGLYTVLVITTENCELSSNITISAANIPVATINPSGNIQSCEDEITLTATGGNLYQWLLNSSPIPGANQNTYIADQAGIYEVVATNNAGCFDGSAPTTVEFLPALSVEIQASNLAPCENENVTLFLNGTYDNYEWSNNQNTSTISINDNNNYSVIVTDELGCIGEAEISVYFIPLPLIDAGDDILSNCVAGALLEAIGEGTITWEENEVLLDGSTTSVLVNPKESMTFTAVAENNGCVNSDDVTVIVDCTSLFIPNSFSPNRDGINDVFLVDGTGIYEFELKIFDRWGELLFFTTDPGDAWTGGFKDYYVPDGVYTYQVKALDFKGNPIIGNGLVLGSILVIR